MSYSSEIGSLQGTINSVRPTEAKPAAQTSISDSGTRGAQQPIQNEYVDQASLSSAGGLMAQALESPDVRLDKVASLQQAIANGSYNVSSSDVADKMIESLLD